MATGAEDFSSMCNWLFAALGGLGTITMAVISALYCRINKVQDGCDEKIDTVETEVNSRIANTIIPIWETIRSNAKTETDRAVDNEKRYALKEDVRDLKTYMDVKFKELGDLVLRALTGEKHEH